MEHDPRGFLHDARKSADAITRFLSDVTESRYLEDEIFRSAVERQFEILGEALVD